MAQINDQLSNHLVNFGDKLQKTCSQLLKEIRKYGDENISTRFYLQEFKNFQIQLNNKEPLKQIFNQSFVNTLVVSQRAANPQENDDKNQDKLFTTDESLKPAIRRQLVLIQSQQTKCREICRLIDSSESLINKIQFINHCEEPSSKELKDKLLEIYKIAEDWLRDLSQIVENLIYLLENHLESLGSSTISFQKSIISPDSNRKSALTSILQSVNRSEKRKVKSDSLAARQPLRESRTQKRLQTKFEISQKPVFKQIVPIPVDKHCGGCLLF